MSADVGNDRVLDPRRLAAVRATGLLDTAPEEAFDELARLAATLLGAPFAFVTLVDEVRSFWKSAVDVTGAPMAARQNTVEESFCRYVVNSGEPLIVGDTAANPLTADNPSIAAMGVAAWAGYPLMSPDGLALGSFCVVDTVVREWTDVHVEVLRTLAAAAARELALRASVEQAHEALALRDAANARVRVLAEIGRALAESLDVEQTVAELARRVVPLLGEWSVVSLTDATGTSRDTGWWHADEQRRPLVDLVVGSRLADLSGVAPAAAPAPPVLVTSDALAVGLRTLAAPAAREAYAALGPGSLAVFPLTTATAHHGSLVVVRDAERPPLDTDEIRLGGAIAHRAAMALDNARLYAARTETAERLRLANRRLARTARHDRVVARALQDAMLTRLPEPDHLHLAARYLTAEHGEQVGGDWYDAVISTDGATTLMIGDVAGHDIAAASFMGQLRNLVRAFAWDRADDPPSRVVARLDAAMHELGIDTTATLAVFRIEQTPEQRESGMRTARWSTAGHPPGILVDPGGRAVLLAERPDPPLGVWPGIARHDHTCLITPGSTLLLFTDGLVETRRLDYDERLAALLTTVEGLTGASPDDLLDGVLETMVGAAPPDDVALLLCRFHPEDRPRPAEAGPEQLIPR